jgi:glucosamine kinase
MAFMGIDGGGSTLRVVIVTETLTPLAQVQRSTANPSVIGREASAALIQEAMREALAQTRAQVEAVGIGVAGASAVYASDWLISVVQSALPGAVVFPSSDNEIALVGAHGARCGVMVLAGTGSVALALDAHAQPVQAGGWGYLLGDEGSGFWLALETLRACARWADGRAPEAYNLAQQMMSALGVSRPVDLIPWLYRQPPPTRELAQHASLVLEAPATDACAQEIVARGAHALAEITRSVIARAQLQAPAIQFCGGLLTFDNSLSAALCNELGLAIRPVPMYPPVIGAALLAMQTLAE